MRFEIDYSDRKEIGRAGEYVSAIGLGTWDIRSRESMVDAISRAVELGLNLVDTAEMYGSGEAEKTVGLAVKRVGRDNIFITTKLMPDKFTSVDKALKAARQSIDRLGVKEVDLLLLHWYEPHTPVSKMMQYLEAIAEKGYARYIGVSNFKVDLLKEAIHSLRKHEIVVNQVRYSVFDKTIERYLLPYMIREGITVQAYTPLEKGKVVNDKTLMEVGVKYGKTPVQVALNYLIAHPRVTTIPKTEKRERVEEYHGAMGWRLTEEDIERLRKL